MGGAATTTSSSSPHTSGGSPASNVIVGNASPSHAQTLSHKVCIYNASLLTNKLYVIYKIIHKDMVLKFLPY